MARACGVRARHRALEQLFRRDGRTGARSACAPAQRACSTSLVSPPVRARSGLLRPRARDRGAALCRGACPRCALVLARFRGLDFSLRSVRAPLAGARLGAARGLVARAARPVAAQPSSLCACAARRPSLHVNDVKQHLYKRPETCDIAEMRPTPPLRRRAWGAIRQRRMSLPVSVRRHVAPVIVLGVLAAGCGHPATREECDEFLRQERGDRARGRRTSPIPRRSPSASRLRARPRGGLRRPLPRRRITKRALECVRRATTADQVDRCSERSAAESRRPATRGDRHAGDRRGLRGDRRWPLPRGVASRDIRHPNGARPCSIAPPSSRRDPTSEPRAQRPLHGSSMPRMFGGAFVI